VEGFKLNYLVFSYSRLHGSTVVSSKGFKVALVREPKESVIAGREEFRKVAEEVYDEIPRERDLRIPGPL
jgi:hypothetical protein